MLGATRVAFIGAAGRPKLVYTLLFQQSFEAAGSTYITITDKGYIDVDFEIWGGGGGGGGRYSTGSGRGASNYGGGGGGGGGYAQHRYSSKFSSGDRINLVVGGGGVGGKYINPVTFYPGGTGGKSEIISHANSSGTTLATITAYATGGLGGLSRTTPYGGTGGIGFGSGVTLSGSNGQDAAINSNGGSGGNGASGGIGGAGAKSLPATAAQDGTPPAGGGGGGAYTGLYDDGEDGAVGRIMVKVYGYTLPPQISSSDYTPDALAFPSLFYCDDISPCADYAEEQINGINQPIILQFNVTATSGTAPTVVYRAASTSVTTTSGYCTSTPQYGVGDGTVQTYGFDGWLTLASGATASVSNGHYLAFAGAGNAPPFPPATNNITIEIVNTSDGNTVLDTVTIEQA